MNGTEVTWRREKSSRYKESLHDYDYYHTQMHLEALSVNWETTLATRYLEFSAYRAKHGKNTLLSGFAESFSMSDDVAAVEFHRYPSDKLHMKMTCVSRGGSGLHETVLDIQLLYIQNSVW